MLRFRPDLCVFLLHLNDVEIPEEGRSKRSARANRDSSFLWSRAVEGVKSLNVSRLLYSKVLLPAAIRWKLPNRGLVAHFLRLYEDDSPAFKRYRYYSEKISALLADTKTAGRFFLLPLPLAQSTPYQLQPANDRVRAVFAENGVEVTELLASYRKFRKDELIIHSFDVHPNRLAARLLADELFGVLRYELQFTSAE